MAASINSVASAKVTRGRGRKRAFDIEAALVCGQAMFHELGYDGVALADLVERLGISPPSFYSAFGSKANFFRQILERYAASVLPSADFYKEEGAPDQVLAGFLERAANQYAKDPKKRGCLVLEAARAAGSTEASDAARQLARRRRSEVRSFVATTHQDAADEVADYVVSVMWGLSASARHGLNRSRLTAIARASAGGVSTILNMHW